MKKQLLINAAIMGIVAASSMTVGHTAMAKSAEKGLCSNASACKGQGGCGEAKGKNDCTGQGKGIMSKAQCDKLAKKDKSKGVNHTWMATPEQKM